MRFDQVIWIAAIGLSAIGFGSLMHMAYIRAVWPRAVGRVVDNVGEWPKSGNSRQAIYFAKIAFVARNGKSYEVKGDIGSNEPWPKGQRVELQYKSSNPKHALTMNLWQQLAFSGVFIVFGALCWAKLGGFIR